MPRRADNAKALDAFLAAKVEIDAMLARLTTASADHFNTAPDAITWRHVGSLQATRDALREIGDASFGEGEHAAA